MSGIVEMKYLLWDFDGTLAQRQGGWSNAIIAVLERAGFSATPDDIRPHIQAGFPWHTPEQVRPPGESPDDWWKRLHPVFANAIEKCAAVGATNAGNLALEVREVYLAGSHWQLFDDTRDALTQLTDCGWRHCILSNHVPELETIVDALGIAPFFERIFNSAVTGVEKPHPVAFSNAVAALPQECVVWMIGDNWHADVRGAEACGIPAILVRSQHELARHCCPRLGDIAAILS